MKYVEYNMNDIKSIKAAERLKTRLENQGYNQRDTMINNITGYVSITYIKEVK